MYANKHRLLVIKNILYVSTSFANHLLLIDDQMLYEVSKHFEYFVKYENWFTVILNQKL